METLKLNSYGGITRNSLFETSNNPGETQNLEYILTPNEIKTDITLGDMVDISMSVKELYAALRV